MFARATSFLAPCHLFRATLLAAVRTRADADGAPAASHRRKLVDAPNNLLRNELERVLDTFVCLGRDLNERDFEFVADCFCFLGRDLLVHVNLVAHEELAYVLIGVSGDVGHPISNIFERFLVRDIVHENNPHCSAIVRLCNCLEALLTGCIPNLQINLLAVDVHDFGLEINPGRADHVLVELIVGKPHHETGLADTTVTEQQEFDDR